MAGRKERIGTISGIDQVRYQAGKMHHEMLPEARRGAGAWRDRTAYDRKRARKELRQQKSDSDYGPAAIPSYACKGFSAIAGELLRRGLSQCS